MLESFITAFVIYFVVVDPIGNAPIFLAVTTHLDKTRKARVALEGTAVATIIMLFFAICGSWILGYLNISEAAFKIAGGLILFTVALDMLTSRRQTRKEQNTARDSDAGAPPPALGESDNVAIFPLAIPLLAGPAAIMSVMVVSADLDGSFALQVTGYSALLAVMVLTGIILSLTVLAERIIDPRAANVFSRITAIILAALSVQYVIDGVTLLGFIAS
ncbi:MarC family protein [Alphaproteobacteria bacterium]|jgi:multiple antibiotic resistance protein|nr:MarC family protein [Alphaproteobacteria bacterium]